jgi:sugar-phosphatase
VIRPLADYAAVLADLDGTLVDSDAAVARAWAGFADRHGLDPATVIREAHGKPARETAARLAPDAPQEPRLLEEAELSDTDGLVALPGARELLAASLTLAIVTSCTRALATVRLAASGLPLPATMICSDEIERGKPDPEGYLAAARRLGADPVECVVLEDAPAGVQAGKAAGMTVIAVRTTHSGEELTRAGADAVLGDLADLELP